MSPRPGTSSWPSSPLEDLKLALRYEGGHDPGELLPETQYGGVTSSLFANAAIALEDLQSEFEDDERDLLITQLAADCSTPSSIVSCIPELELTCRV